MPASRAEIVKLARTCLGTPFRHQGRLPGHGLDCAGLIIHVSNTLGLSEPYAFTSYSHFPNQSKVQLELSQYMTRVSVEGALPADVALIADDGNHSCHMGILARDARGELTLIHASARHRSVVEHCLDDDTRKRMRGVFRFKGISESEQIWTHDYWPFFGGRF
jgi:cell wall-associated NlpC family hydrolase